MARAFLTVKGLMQSIYGEPIDSRVPQAYFEIETRLKQTHTEMDSYLDQAREIQKRSVNGTRI